MYSFLYDGDLRHERVKSLLTFRRTCSVEINSKQQYLGTVFLTYSFMYNLTYSELYKKKVAARKHAFGTRGINIKQTSPK